MIGCYDFCGHYEWTFDWIEKNFGREALRDYWRDAISGDSQIHAAMAIQSKGIVGMEEYWGHTLAEEAAGFTSARTNDSFRINMHECPSKGFLINNGLENHSDYCDHCMGWIGPTMEKAGFVVDHEHNHRGTCWWVFRPKESEAPSEESPEITQDPKWASENAVIDRYEGAVHPDHKTIDPPSPPRPLV